MAINIFKEIPLKGYQKTIPWIILMMICMIIVPLIAYISGYDNSGVIGWLISICAMPVFTIILGISAGEDIKHQWFLPAVPIVFRCIGGLICNEEIGEYGCFAWSIVAGIAATAISTVVNAVARTMDKRQEERGNENT